MSTLLYQSPSPHASRTILKQNDTTRTTTIPYKRNPTIIAAVDQTYEARIKLTNKACGEGREVGRLKEGKGDNPSTQMYHYP